MGSPLVNMTFQNMQKSIVEFEVIKGKLNSIHGRIVGDVQAINAGWGGESGPAYQAAMGQWETKFGTIIQRLQDVITALGGTKTGMQRLESDNTMHIQGFSSTLNT